MISIISEPRDETYFQLLQVALELSNTFSLVWRDQLQFDQSAKDLEKELVPFLEKELRSDVWPGTQLLGDFATLRFYKYTDQSKAILEKVQGLYNWRAPDFPEDLAFYRADGRCWLGSIAHEKDAFLDIDENQIASLYSQIPGLKVESHWII